MESSLPPDPTRAFPAIIDTVARDGLTYLSADALTDLHAAVLALEARGAPGILVEAGCALGGSAIVLTSAKSAARPLFVYDVFGLIPPPSAHDGPDVHERYRVIRTGTSPGIAGGRYYGYEDDLLGKVAAAFERHGLSPAAHNVKFVRGLFADTLHLTQPVALAHLDSDWYESTRTCLERIVPWLIPGGGVVVDDYHTWSGCRRAVDEYFADRRGDYDFVEKARLHIRRRDP